MAWVPDRLSVIANVTDFYWIRRHRTALIAFCSVVLWRSLLAWLQDFLHPCSHLSADIRPVYAAMCDVQCNPSERMNEQMNDEWRSEWIKYSQRELMIYCWNYSNTFVWRTWHAGQFSQILLVETRWGKTVKTEAAKTVDGWRHGGKGFNYY